MNTQLFAILASILLATSAISSAAFALSGSSSTSVRIRSSSQSVIPADIGTEIENSEHIELPEIIPLPSPTSPVVVFTLSPEDGDFVSGTVPVRALMLSDNNISEIKAFVTQSSGGTSTETQINLTEKCRIFDTDPVITFCRFDWNTAGLSGQVQLKIRATDDHSNIGESIVTVKASQILVDITQPDNYKKVQGTVQIGVKVQSINTLSRLELDFDGVNKDEEFLILDKCEITGSAPIKAACKFDWNSTGFDDKVIVTAKVNDSQNNSAEDSIVLFVIPPVQPEPSEPSTLTVKAFDSATGNAVSGALTVILRKGAVGLMKGIEIDEDDIEDILEDIDDSEIEISGKGRGRLKARLEYATVNYATGKETVVGIIKADGQESMQLKPGVYRLVTYAEGYAPFVIDKLVVGANKEYNLHASLSKKSSTASSEITEVKKPVTPGKLSITVTEITENGELVKIVAGVKKITIEVIPGHKTKEVTINPSVTGEGKWKYVIESEDIEATTDADVEINQDKFFIKNENVKKQVKVLPSLVTELANERGIKSWKDIRLQIINQKPAYTVEGEESGNLLAFIPVKMHAKAIVDAETGQVVSIEKPFWSFLVVPTK